MLIKCKKVVTDRGCTQRAQSIEVTHKHIDKLNREIQAKVLAKEVEREKGLEIAVRCRMR